MYHKHQLQRLSRHLVNNKGNNIQTTYMKDRVEGQVRTPLLAD